MGQPFVSTEYHPLRWAHPSEGKHQKRRGWCVDGWGEDISLDLLSLRPVGHPREISSQ